MEPLWRLDREQILNEFVSAGFEAIVVSARADIFGPEWLGRRIDKSFIKDLLKLKSTRNFDLCGEFGEYHTLVVDGPIFKRSIKIRAFEKVLKEDRQRRQRWLLDIIDFSLKEKRRRSLGKHWALDRTV